MPFLHILAMFLCSAVLCFAQEQAALEPTTTEVTPETTTEATQENSASEQTAVQEPVAMVDSTTQEEKIEVTAASDVKKDEASTISVFVKRPEEIQALQKDLINLQNLAGGSNPAIDSLLSKASRIAKMNDQCSMVSINDILDTSCSHFYEIELPAFENEFMELTGEVRLGSMRMASTLEERSQQLLSCSDALTSIVVPRDQLLRLRGNIYLEPINLEGDFDAEYRYELSYDSTKMHQQERLANLWLSKCGDIVLRQTGEEFAPMFVAALKIKNDSLKKEGSNIKLLLNKENLSIRVNMRRAISGAYYLNGEKLFSKELEAAGEKPHLRFDVKNKKALLESGADATLENFKGKVVFRGLKKQDMAGRWMWDKDLFVESGPDSQDEADLMTAEDSLVYEQVLTEAATVAIDTNQTKATAAAEAATNNNEPQKEGSSINWIPLAISGAVLVGGTIMAVAFNSKAKTESEDYKKELDDGDDSNYKKHKDNASSAQTLRTIGFGFAIAGGIGIGLSFIF